MTRKPSSPQAYPTPEAVESATLYRLAEWSRFLRGPNDGAEAIIIGRIFARFQELGGWTPRLSREVGWD